MATLLTSAVLSLLSFDASRADPATPADTITIEARREQLRQAVNQFVQGTIVRPNGTEDSLLRWNGSICPLVAGLKREDAEFVLRRFSEIARAAKAPLAGESCYANLFIIVAQNPPGFLELWWQHDHRLFNTASGVGAVNHFIDTPRPVRVWYNDVQADPGTGAEIAAFPGQGFGLAQTAGLGSGQREVHYNRQPGLGSRLTLPAVRAIASVIVVIDAEKVSRPTFGQLTDFVSMVALAEINPDTNVGAAPSILKVFSDPEGAAPQSLSAWDQALLHAVYSTRQRDRKQLSEIETAALEQIKAADLR